MSIDDRYQRALEIFFAENQHLLRVEPAHPTDLEALGITPLEYEQHKRDEIFSQAAKDRQIEVSELVIRLAAESPEQAHSWRIDIHRRTAEALGIEWTEYKIINHTEE